MRASGRSKLAVDALLIIARNNKTTSLCDMAKAIPCSQSYLEQIFADLKSAKIVRSNRGRGGGYVLSAPASATSILSIVNAVDGYTSDAHTAKEPWSVASCKAREYLSKISLHDLLH